MGDDERWFRKVRLMQISRLSLVAAGLLGLVRSSSSGAEEEEKKWLRGGTRDPLLVRNLQEVGKLALFPHVKRPFSKSLVNNYSDQILQWACEIHAPEIPMEGKGRTGTSRSFLPSPVPGQSQAQSQR